MMLRRKRVYYDLVRFDDVQTAVNNPVSSREALYRLSNIGSSSVCIAGNVVFPRSKPTSLKEYTIMCALCRRFVLLTRTSRRPHEAPQTLDDCLNRMSTPAQIPDGGRHNHTHLCQLYLDVSWYVSAMSCRNRAADSSSIVYVDVTAIVVSNIGIRTAASGNKAACDVELERDGPARSPPSWDSWVISMSSPFWP